MRNAPETRASLILRLRDRTDAEAWREFTEIYHPLIYRLVRGKGFQHNDALDMAQEVLVRVAQAIHDWEPDPTRGTFRGWLHRVTRNLMINFLEHGQRRFDPSGGSGLIDLPEQADAEHGLFDLEFRRQLFAWAADKLEASFQPRTWQAFWRTAVDNQSAAEVARDLEMTPGAVYVARSRVMQRLRQEVQRILTEDAGALNIRIGESLKPAPEGMS